MIQLRLWGLFVLVSVAANAAARLPIEDFAREPDMSCARLSPDGQRLAFLRNRDGYPQLHIAELGTNRVSYLDLGEAALANNARKGVGYFAWVSDRRLIITTLVWDGIYGVLATDWNGEHSVPISGSENNTIVVQGRKLWAYEVIHRFFDREQRILMLDQHEDGGGAEDRPDVLMVNTTTGGSYRIVKNPGNVKAWGTDANGVVRYGITSEQGNYGIIYRDTEKSPWRTLVFPEDRDGLLPAGFDSVNNRLLVASVTPQRRWTLFPVDPGTQKLGEPLLSDPLYDIYQNHFTPSMNGHALEMPVFSPRRDALLGLRFVTDAPRVKWFDRDLAKAQAAFDRAAPDTLNVLADLSHDGKRQLWFAFSDQHPGRYILANTEKRTMTPLASARPWLDPKQMAPTLAIKYQARDGLTIHGLLTLPRDAKPKGLPMVIHPHGGPWVRDVWGFDPLVQLLANRGYAVLQMNYRGSPGYGEELYAAAKRQVGRQIQDDIEDGTRWAIAAGIANPQRIAILGASYGGYSALFGLGRNPDLYRCGISLAGVTDWYAIHRKSDVAEDEDARRYWREQIGDPGKDMEFLKSISPVNFADKIAAPVLIIHGKEDRRVPLSQARAMIAALQKAGRPSESLLLADVGHGFGEERHRIQIYRAMVEFLEQHLGAGVE